MNGKAFTVLENEAQQWYLLIGHTWKALGSGTLPRTRRSTTTRTCAIHTETLPVPPSFLPHPSVVTKSPSGAPFVGPSTGLITSQQKFGFLFVDPRCWRKRFQSLGLTDRCSPWTYCSRFLVLLVVHIWTDPCRTCG